MRACHAGARVRFPVGTGFLREFFWGFSSPVRQMSGNFRPTMVPEYHLDAIIIISYSLCWHDWVCAWCVSSFMFVLSRRWPWCWADRSSGETLHVLVWSKSMHVIQRLIPSPDRSWLCKARAAWVREPIRGRLKSGNEKRNCLLVIKKTMCKVKLV